MVTVGDYLRKLLLKCIVLSSPTGYPKSSEITVFSGALFELFECVSFSYSSVLNI